MRWIITALFLLVAAPALAQAPSPDCDLPAPGAGNAVNPTRVCFQVNDEHDMLDRYDLDIINPSGTLDQTINMGLPPAPTTADGTRWVNWNNLNVMPRAFGVGYTSVVRAVAGTAESADSIVSNNWDRAPGRPGGPRIVRGLKWLGKGMWAGVKGGGRGLASIQHIVR